MRKITIILAIIGSCVSVGLSIYFSSWIAWLIALSTITGILATVFTYSGKWVCFAFDIISYILYIYICILCRYYGEMILACINIVMYIPAMIEWQHHKDIKDRVIVRRISRKETIITITICILSTIAYTIFLFFINTQYPLLNALPTVVFILGNYYAYRRSQFQLYCWVMYEILFCTLWLLAGINNSPEDIIFLVEGLTEVAILTLGIFNWKKIIQEQKPMEKENE